VANGTDAWAVGLGVPVNPAAGFDAAVPRRYFVESGRGETGPAGWPSWLGGRKRDPLVGRSGVWDEKDAYWHTLVTGNDGHIINRIPEVENEAAAAAFVCREQPAAWLKKRDGKKRIVLYAHGGLNSEQNSVRRVRVLGPSFKDNGIYPVFTTWKSGWKETIVSMIDDGVKQVFGQPAPAEGIADELAEAWDRMVEAAVRRVLVKAMWSEMKENVSRGAGDGRGLDSLAGHLAGLAGDVDGLEVHLVGHSAGSFVCGGLLNELRVKAPDLKVASCTLYAPACSLEFALNSFKAAVEAGQLQRNKLRIHVLSDERELDDTVGPYRKSLLYLVSRALERHHKTPLLGLASSYDGDRATREYWHEKAVGRVKAWQEFFWGAAPKTGFASHGGDPGGNLSILAARQVNVGPRRISSSHGCFDNSIDVVSQTIERITGAKPARKITNLDY
jgi:hypothetical protein